MKIVVKSIENEYQETLLLENIDNIDEILKKFSSIQEPFEAKIFSTNESISAHKLLKLKNYGNMNSSSLSIYSIIFLMRLRSPISISISALTCLIL